MSKKPKIRWRESDVREVERLVRNFNAKLRRIEKNRPEDAKYMPARKSKKDLIEDIKTRADLRRTLGELERFNKRGSEKLIKSKRGAVATEWEVKEFERKQKAVNRKRKKEAERIGEKEVTSRGKPVGSKRKEMGSIKENAVKPLKKKFENLSNMEWDKAKKAIDNELDEKWNAEKKERIKANYIKGLTDRGFSGALIKLVESVPLDIFIDTIDTDTEATFEFVYSEEEHKAKEEILGVVWSSALNR